MKVGIISTLTVIESDEVRLICQGATDKEFNIHFKDGSKVTMDFASKEDRNFALERLIKGVSQYVDETLPD